MPPKQGQFQLISPLGKIKPGGASSSALGSRDTYKNSYCSIYYIKKLGLDGSMPVQNESYLKMLKVVPTTTTLSDARH